MQSGIWVRHYGDVEELDLFASALGGGFKTLVNAIISTPA
jgi:hypothetical protein